MSNFVLDTRTLDSLICPHKSAQGLRIGFDRQKDNGW